ncbi:MAG: acyclic terpene utilization AtuA family protein [Solirubrobacteraceae bacterium]
MSAESIRIGIGSASSEDRIEPAAELVEEGRLDYLALDCLAERTLAFAQLRRLADPSAGYDERLERIVEELAIPCLSRGTRLIANMGAANPAGAAARTRELLAEHGRGGARVAAIVGDDALELIRARDPIVVETGRPVSELESEVVSANAYIGSDGIVEALRRGADVVIGGRIADPSLCLAPAICAHGWSAGDLDARAGGLVVGHLLECGTYLTGANWVDPPYREVPDLWSIGLPYADVFADGTAIVGKLDGTGGAVSVENCKGELIYEIGDPSAYLTPDLVVDVTQVAFEQVGPDRVRMRGARGKPATGLLKVLIGCLEGHVAEGEVSFGGPGALRRAKLCAEVVKQRLERAQLDVREMRVDYIGLDSVFGPASPAPAAEPWEVRLRIAARVSDEATAERVREELTLTWFGPSGAGGVRTSVREILGMCSALVPRELVPVEVQVLEV